jgi:hypothetical protein
MRSGVLDPQQKRGYYLHFRVTQGQRHPVPHRGRHIPSRPDLVLKCTLLKERYKYNLKCKYSNVIACSRLRLDPLESLHVGRHEVLCRSGSLAVLLLEMLRLLT